MMAIGAIQLAEAEKCGKSCVLILLKVYLGFWKKLIVFLELIIFCFLNNRSNLILVFNYQNMLNSSY